MSTSHAIGRSSAITRGKPSKGYRPRTNRPEHSADHAGDVLMRTWQVQPSRRAAIISDLITWMLIGLALFALVFRQWFGLVALALLTLAYVAYVMWVASPTAKRRRAKRRSHLLV